MHIISFLVHAAVLAAITCGPMACAKEAPLYCATHADCPPDEYPERSYCDTTGNLDGSDGHPNTCVSPPRTDGGLPDANTVSCTSSDECTALSPDLSFCSPNGMCLECQPGTEVCADGVYIACDSVGTRIATRDCALDCHSTEPRCADIEPSNGLAEYLDEASNAIDLELPAGSVINTDSGDIVDGNGTPILVASSLQVAGAGGVDIRVFPIKSLTLFDTTVVGTNALAFVSDGDVVLAGTLTVAAESSVSGPGALIAASSCHGEDGTYTDGDLPGGGGGGFGGTGGNGGAANAILGGAGGAQSGAQDLQPLRGGCRGGESKTSGVNLYGGGGGGAVQITSRTLIDMTTNLGVGRIHAGGGGAHYFCTMLTCRTAGPGGGSGGGVLLEAPAVIIGDAGGVSANGGGGGCYGTPAGDAAFGIAPGSGATCTNPDEGDGGDGGSNGTQPQNGQTVSGSAGGGGGGAVGRIRINTATGTIEGSAGSILSPQPSLGFVQTR